MNIKRKSIRKVVIIGPSQGITIPNDVLEEVGLTVGDYIILDVIDNKILIKKADF